MSSKAAHHSCMHKSYAVSCDEYEALRDAAGGDCQMCGTPTVLLVIDHDHALGQWAVRGLLCTSCNVTLGRIEGGRSPMTPSARRYLDAPWHRIHGWTDERGGFREQVTCPACGRLVGKMLNGIPYLHRARPGSDVYCSGTTLERKAWRKQKRTWSVPPFPAGDASLSPWFRESVAIAIAQAAQRPDFLEDSRPCDCGHDGTVHETNGRCLAATDWCDCPCVSYQPQPNPCR